jgi:ribosomal protein S27E
MKFISTFYKYFLVFWLIFTAFSGKSQDFNCLDCHEDYTLNSAHHKVVSCNDCHKDVINEEHAEKGAKMGIAEAVIPHLRNNRLMIFITV